MRLCSLTYEEAQRRHPLAVEAILHELRLSRSKERDAEPQELTWGYDCAISTKGYTLGEVLSGKARDDREAHEALTFEERVVDQVNRTSTRLKASKGRWVGSHMVANPPEVEEWARASTESRERDDAAFAALSQEEKDLRLQEALGQLSKDPGFRVFSLRK